MMNWGRISILAVVALSSVFVVVYMRQSEITQVEHLDSHKSPGRGVLGLDEIEPLRAILTLVCKCLTSVDAGSPRSRCGLK